jgi:hypothetical protein
MLSDPEVALHEVQESSRAWASPPATPYDKDTPVSSASWISGEASLIVPSGVTHSWTTAAGSSGTRTSSTSVATRRDGDDPASLTTTSVVLVPMMAAAVSAASAS